MTRRMLALVLVSALCTYSVSSPISVYGTEPANDQLVTAGFHRRGPDHPAGGSQATCIGEEGLRNPFNNGTTLATGYPATLLTEESLASGTFGTETYRTGPSLRAEIEDLDDDLFDKRGAVRMVLLASATSEGGVITTIERTNFRWIATAGGHYCDRMAGETEIMYLHSRGNAGGHIEVATSRPMISVKVEDNNGNPSEGSNKYLDGQEADITVTVEPEFYAQQLTNIVWDRVATDPEGNEANNPAESALEVVSIPGDWTKTKVPNVRWAGMQSGVDARSGTPKYCNVDATWIIDGTFTIAGVEMPGANNERGELVATVKLGGYINGAAKWDFLVAGTASANTIVLARDAPNVLLIGGDTGTLRWELVNPRISVMCIEQSQFFQLAEEHEKRYLAQASERKGPWGPFTAEAFIRAINGQIEQLNSDSLRENGSFPAAHIRDTAAQANELYNYRVRLLARLLSNHIIGNSPEARCWLERDADAAAKIATGKNWFWSIECRYPGCGDFPDCEGCGAPDGQN